MYFETVTLVTHQGRPLASRCCRDEGGELAATKALLDDVDVRGCLVTLDALHTNRDTERAIVDIHRADYLFTVKDNGPETCAMLSTLDWNAPSVRHHRTPPEKGHGRVETRHIDALTVPERMTPFAHARQAMRVTRERTDLTTANTTTETAYALTSVSAERAGPDSSSPGIVAIGWSRTPTTIAVTQPSARTQAASVPDTPPPTTPH